MFPVQIVDYVNNFVVFPVKHVSADTIDQYKVFAAASISQLLFLLPIQLYIPQRAYVR